MDSLTTRLAISRAVEQNRQNPQQVENGYHLTKLNDTITIAHNPSVPMSPEETWINDRTVPDDGSWQETLRRHQRLQTPFADPQFPPDASSLYLHPSKLEPLLSESMGPWKRLSAFFQETVYVEISMVDDIQKLVCSISIKSKVEAESIIQVVRTNPTPIDSSFLQLAQRVVRTGLERKRKEHLLLCTTNMIQYLSEYVEQGLQRFDLLWTKSVLEPYEPLTWTGIDSNRMVAYRLDGSEAGFVSKVSVLVPIQFQALDTCLFDPSTESTTSGVSIEPGQVRLGRLGDAYLMGAFSILSTSPFALAQVFPLTSDHQPQVYNPQGVYAVRFWRGHRSRVVVIDDYIPCSRTGKPMFASFTGRRPGVFELWTILIEKAYAKLMGGYEAISGGLEGLALQDLYGGIPQTMSLEGWSQLTHALSSGSLIGVIQESTAPHLESGISSMVAYGVIRAVEVEFERERVQLVQLRNSWGTNEVYTGPWSRFDERWNRLNRQQKVEMGFQFQEDGTIWMEFRILTMCFTTLVQATNVYHYTSSPEPKLYQSLYIITSGWNGPTNGGRQAMHLNPQYHLTTTHSNQLLVSLEQPMRQNDTREYKTLIAPIVCQQGIPTQRMIDITPHVLATGTFISNRSSLLDEVELPLSSQSFVVIPATYDAHPSTSLSFTLVLGTTQPSTLSLLDDYKTLPTCTMCQTPLSQSFRTFSTSTANETTSIDRVCEQCVDLYRDRHTPSCIYCHERIEAVVGRFSGRMFTLEDQTSLHAECMDAYRLAMAPKCIQCKKAIALIEGQFSGQFVDLANQQGQCHVECLAKYQQAIAKTCQYCFEPVMAIPGRFDGRFYQLAPPRDDQQVHFECWDAYQRAEAPKCVHCQQAIIKQPGISNGEFYELTSGLGKVHGECWELYQASIFKR